MSKALEELSTQEVVAEASCQHTLVRWHPPRPSLWRTQKIVDSFPCGQIPTIAWVTTSCAACSDARTGPWCAKCLQDEQWEYQNNRLSCWTCHEFKVVMTVRDL